MPRSDNYDDDDRPRRDDGDDRPRRRPRDDDDDYRPHRPKRKSYLWLILGLLGGFMFILVVGCVISMIWGTSRVRDAAERMESSNNEKQIALACQNYESANNGFPTNSYDDKGKPLLSWRVHILPYLEEDVLYRQFKLDEPWDGPNNRLLLSRMPRVYATHDERTGRVPLGTKTFYRGFSNPGAMFARFDPPRGHGIPIGVRRNEITDGMSNTILVVEAGESVDWTKPEDLDASPGKPFPSLGGYRPKSDVINIVLVDGSVRAVKKTLPEAQWRAGITYAGNDFANFDQ